jgi:hypothetical protein
MYIDKKCIYSPFILYINQALYKYIDHPKSFKNNLANMQEECYNNKKNPYPFVGNQISPTCHSDLVHFVTIHHIGQLLQYLGRDRAFPAKIPCPQELVHVRVLLKEQQVKLI